MKRLNNLYFELTGACNLLCKHCYVFTSDKARERPDLLTPALIEEAVSHGIENGLQLVTFTGGEIFLRKDIREILTRIAKYPVKMCLLTNLTLVDGADIEWIAQLPIHYVSTSVDGLEKTHDEFRGKSGALAATLTTLEKLRNAKVPVKVSITVGKHNIDHAAELFASFDALEIPTSIAKIVSIGRGRLIDISDADLDRRYLSLLSERLGKELIHAQDDDFSTGGKILSTYCGVGDDMLYVMSNGKVAYCPTLTAAQGDEWVVGDLLSQSLPEIWRSGTVFEKALQCRDISTCSIGKVCRGGCRANAYAKTGDISACDEEIYAGISGWKTLHRQVATEFVYLAT